MLLDVDTGESFAVLALRRIRVGKKCVAIYQLTNSTNNICILLLVTVVLGEPNLIDSFLMKPLRVKRNCCFGRPSPPLHNAKLFVGFRYGSGSSQTFVRKFDFCAVSRTLSTYRLPHLYRRTWHNNDY